MTRIKKRATASQSQSPIFCSIVWFPSHVASNFDPFIDVHVCVYMINHEGIRETEERRGILFNQRWHQSNTVSFSMKRKYETVGDTIRVLLAISQGRAPIFRFLLLVGLLITHIHICLYFRHHSRFTSVKATCLELEVRFGLKLNPHIWEVYILNYHRTQ